MNIHPTTLQLSKHLWRYLPIPGAVAAATFLATLSHGVYPGDSAALTAAAAGLIPPSGADHPVYALLLRLLAGLPVFSLPVRLNLFSALCGTACVLLLYHLVSRLLLFFSCENSGDDEHIKFEASETVEELPQEVLLVNRRMAPLAVSGGLIAALLLTFTVPLWAAATRAHPAPFDLLLALASLSLMLTFHANLRLAENIPVLVLSVFLFTVGLFETAAFLALLPFYAYFFFTALALSPQQKPVTLPLLLAVAVGVGCGLFAFFQNMSTPEPLELSSRLTLCLSAFISHRRGEILSFLPSAGWVPILLQTVLPAMILLLWTESLFKEGQRGRMPAMLVLTLAAVPGLLNLPFAPVSFFHSVDHLPVFGSAVLAAATAIVIAACLKMPVSPDEAAGESDESEDLYAVAGKRRARIAHFFATCCLVTLTLLAILSPWRSFRDTDTRSSFFADVAAHNLIQAMGNRTWLISNGPLDNHLLIQALILKHPLTLVTLQQRTPPRELLRLKSLLATDPIFDSQNRNRLLESLSIGTTAFIMEWLKTDPQAADRVMFLDSPDIWPVCGYRAIPEGLAFGGLPTNTVPDVTKITKQNQCFADGIEPLLAPPKIETGQAASLRAFLRLKTGVSVNELGVFLEEVNLPDDAFHVYLRAGQLDPMNISANVNGYVLASALGMHPEALERLRREIKSRSSDPVFKDPALAEIIQTYGTIRQPAQFRQQLANWSATSAPAAGTAKIEKTALLPEANGVSTLVGNALLYLKAGDYPKAEECCLAALEKDPENLTVLSTMATLRLNSRKLDEAQSWLNRAVRARQAQTK